MFKRRNTDPNDMRAHVMKIQNIENKKKILKTSREREKKICQHKNFKESKWHQTW